MMKKLNFDRKVEFQFYIYKPTVNKIHEGERPKKRILKRTQKKGEITKKRTLIKKKKKQ